MQDTNLLNTTQAAKALGVSVDQIRRMISNGQIKSIQTHDRSPHLIPTAEILRNTEIKPRSSRMSFEEYCELDGLNASLIKRLNKSLNHYLSTPSDPSPAMAKGTAIHDSIELRLAGKSFGDKYVIAPNVDRRTKAGREEYDQFVAEEKRTVLKKEDYEDVVLMTESVFRHPEFWRIIPNAEVEQVITWEENGIRAKARLDYSDEGQHLVVDLKSAQDASPYGFKKAVTRYQYDIQANWYRRAYQSVSGHYPEFLFLVVENAAPYNVALYKLSDELMHNAEFKINQAVELYKQYLSGEIYSQGYHEDVMELS